MSITRCESSILLQPEVLFGFENYGQMACTLTASGECQPGRFSIARFDNGELHVRVPDSISGKCLILGSIAPPEHQLLSVLLLAHTLKASGASHITGIFPYLAYSRHDKAKAGESLATAWVAAMLQASGFDRVLTVDLHSQRDMKLFQVPLVSVSPARLFADVIHHHGLLDASIVAVDDGAVARCEAVRQATGLHPSKIPYFEKRRTRDGVVHGNLIGNVRPRVILVDDMLDTGGTLVSACERLMALNVEEVYIFVTHGLFTGTQWERLWSLRVKHIFCTDTVQPFASGTQKRANLTILSVESLLRERLSSQGVNRMNSQYQSGQ